LISWLVGVDDRILIQKQEKSFVERCVLLRTVPEHICRLVSYLLILCMKYENVPDHTWSVAKAKAYNTCIAPHTAAAAVLFMSQSGRTAYRLFSPVLLVFALHMIKTWNYKNRNRTRTAVFIKETV